MAIEHKFYIHEALLTVRSSKIYNKIVQKQNIFPVFFFASDSILGFCISHTKSYLSNQYSRTAFLHQGVGAHGQYVAGATIFFLLPIRDDR